MRRISADAVANARVQRHRAFDRRLRVELGGEADLEQDVFHHVAAVGSLQHERLALEQHVVEAPGLGAQHRRIAHFALGGHQREPHRPRRRVAGRPALARSGVRRVPVGAQALAVDPGERHRVDDLVVRQPEHLCDHRGGRDLDQHDVIEADAVEAVLQRDHALDLVRLDHRRQHRLHRQRRLARGDRGARQPVGGGENAAEIVGRMAPLGREPGVVEVQPADHRADVERRLHRIELELRARNARPVRHDGAGNDRAEQLGARRIGQRLEPAAQRVDQAVARGFVRFAAFDLVARRVVGDVDQDLVGFRTDAGDRCGHRRACACVSTARSCASRRSASVASWRLHR